MKLAVSPTGVTSIGGLMEWLRSLTTSIAAGWNVEHDGTGHHDWHWTTPQFVAARFQGDGTITWAVEGTDVVHERYGVQGDLMVWSLWVQTSSTGGSASAALRVVIPGGYLAVDPWLSPTALVVDAGTVRPGYVQPVIGQPYLEIRNEAGAWSAAAANNTTVIFTVQLRVTK